MAASIEITTAAPMMTIQDSGRPDVLKIGLSASGPMDIGAFHMAGQMLGGTVGAALEFGCGRLVFRIRGGPVRAAFAGGVFDLVVDCRAAEWETSVELAAGVEVVITPGNRGNFGLVRFDRELNVPKVLGSRATNLIAGIGGLDGRCLMAGDQIEFIDILDGHTHPAILNHDDDFSAPIRFIWGIHADLYSAEVRQSLISKPFRVSSKFDRMGMRLEDVSNVFEGHQNLSLVSDVVVPGDMQVLGDGTPIILMRDHQPTGGYARIATVISPDLDRLAQIRPGTDIQFAPVSVAHAQRILAGK